MRRVGLFRSFPFSAACVSVCGLCASFALFFWSFCQEQRSEQATFERRARYRATAVQQGVSDATEVLQVVNQLFATKGNVSREQFHSFTQPLRARHPYIESLSFSRLVSRAERPVFEAQMRRRYPGFMIAEIVDGKRVAAAVKDRYRVVDYLEPMAGNEAAFGLDGSSRPFQDPAIQRAADTGLPSATGLYQLYKDRTGAQKGFRLLMAVYQGGAAPDDVASRQRAVVGYAVLVLRADALFEEILASVGSPGNAGLDIRVYAAASADENKLVYGFAGAATEHLEWWQPAWWFGTQPKPISHRFDIAGTAWHMVISPQLTPFVAIHNSALLALLIGLLTTVAATAYLRSAALRTQRIERLVAQRTDELKLVNELLIVREQRARELAELSSDWSWTLDEHLGFYSIAASSEDRCSPLPWPTFGKSPWEMPVDLGASDWPALRAQLQAHQAFKDFEFKTLIDGSPSQWLSISGKPQFDAQGKFTGYLGTSRIISKRKEAEEALRNSRSKLRKLARHQEQVKEDERRRIARDIHDDLGQNLMALRIDMSVLAARSTDVTVTKEWIEATLSQIDTTIKAVRTIINDLRPTVLDLGLHTALEWQAIKFEQRTGIACQLQLGHDEIVLDDQCSTALFRIVQEALTNIMRHAQARQVQIEMQRTDGRLSMTIADDGVGLAADSIKKENSFGLTGIEERIDALEGTLSVVSKPGQGTALMLSIPLKVDITVPSQVVA
jgi:signal transduction histidine kinase